MKTRWLAAIAGLTVLTCVGCNLFNQHSQMMDAMRGVMKDASDRLGQEGQGMIQASGQVNNPGVRVSAGMEYFAIARYEGLSGQVSAGMSGKLDRFVPDSVRAEAQKIWRNTSWSTEDRRNRIMELLRPWNDAAVDKLIDDLSTGRTTTQPSN